MGKHIQIVTLPGEKLRPACLISRLAGLWREQGYKISVGPSRRLDGDAGIMHVDRTSVPAQYIPDNPQRRPLLNASVLDISKRRISRNLVGIDSDHAGRVIVKTNANYFGWAERLARPSGILWRCVRLLGSTLSWKLTRELLSENYPVYENLSRVPEWVWFRDDLVVERFLPEIEKDEFVLRIWMFFGDQEYGARIFSPDPIVKMRVMTHYEYIDGVPETIRDMRRKLGMDFGKLDYVLVNGEAILLDVNKTPAVSASRSPSANLRRLASGLAYYLEHAQ
jgi:hypothetical protein